MQSPTTYDKEKWHAGSLPKGTPRSQAFVHIAMYLTWIITRRLHDSAFFAALPDGDRYVRQVFSRKRTAMSMRTLLDGSLPSEALSTEAQAFSDWYYAEDHAKYLDDWVAEFGENGDRYLVPDSWETFDRIATRISEQFHRWTQEYANRAGEERAEPESESALHPPLVDSPVDAAARAIASAGGIVVPGPIERLRDESASGLSAQQLAQVATHLESDSDDQRRVAVAKLAAAPMTDEIEALLRRAAQSPDPVVAAIAMHALGLEQ